MIGAVVLGDFMGEKTKTWRVVVDGNSDYRLQYSFQSGAQIGPTTWYWDERKFSSAEKARFAVKELVVTEIIGEF